MFSEIKEGDTVMVRLPVGPLYGSRRHFWVPRKVSSTTNARFTVGDIVFNKKNGVKHPREYSSISAAAVGSKERNEYVEKLNMVSFILKFTGFVGVKVETSGLKALYLKVKEAHSLYKEMNL